GNIVMKEQMQVAVCAISLADEKPVERLIGLARFYAAGLRGECQRQRLLAPVLMMNDGVAGEDRPRASLAQVEFQNRAGRKAFDIPAGVAQKDYVIFFLQVRAKDRLRARLEVGAV